MKLRRVFDLDNFFPDILIYEKNKILTRNGGWLISKSEWEEIRKNMNKFYRNKSDEDIQKINKDMDEEREKAYEKEREESRNKPKYKKPKKPGCVYFIGCEEVGVKIGYSTNVQGRFKTLNIACPYELEILREVKCGNYEEVEKWAHEYFEKRKMSNEWFDITLEEIDMWLGGLTRG